MIPPDRDPGHLDPTFRVKFEALLAACKAHGQEYRLCEGYRSPERSDELARDAEPGKAVAPGGKSAHNYRVAADVAAVVNGALTWTPVHLFDTLAEIAPRYGLETGRDWKKADAGHVQLAGWSYQFADVTSGHSTT